MKDSRFVAVIILLCAASLVFAMAGGGGSGSGQKTHRGFAGKVTDGNGRPIQNVEISLFWVDAATVEEVKAANVEEKPALETKTGSNGRYRFLAVRPGFYRVRYAFDGHQTVEKMMQFKRGARDAVFNIELRQLTAGSSTPAGNQP